MCVPLARLQEQIGRNHYCSLPKCLREKMRRHSVSGALWQDGIKQVKAKELAQKLGLQSSRGALGRYMGVRLGGKGWTAAVTKQGQKMVLGHFNLEIQGAMAVRIQRLKDSEKDAQDMEKAANAMVLIAAKMATIACRACGTKGGSCNCNEKAFLEAKAAWAAFRHVRGEGKTRDHLKPTAATEYARKLQPATVRHGPGPGPGATEIVTIDDDEDQARDQPQKRPPQTPARSPATPGKRLKAAPATPAPAKKYSVEDEVLHRDSVAKVASTLLESSPRHHRS